MVETIVLHEPQHEPHTKARMTQAFSGTNHPKENLPKSKKNHGMEHLYSVTARRQEAQIQLELILAEE